MDFKTEYINKDIDPFYIGSNACSISEDGEIMATANFEDVVITNLKTNEIIDKIEGDGEVITSLTITPNGSYLAIISQSQQLRIYDLTQQSIVKSFKMSSPVYVSTRDSTSTLFAFGGTDGTITVWDIEGGFVTHSLKGHGTTISSLSFYGNLNIKDWKLASGDTQGTVKVWDLIKRKAVHTFKEHTSAVRGVSFDLSGEYFLTGGRDEIVIIYKNFKPIKTIVINQQIEVARFLTNGSRSNQLCFLTAGLDNSLKIWDANSERLVNETVNYKTEEELIIMDVISLNDNLVYVVISDQTLVKLDLNDFENNLPVVSRIAGNHGIIADVKYVGPEFNLLGLATNSPSLRIVDPENPLEAVILNGHRDLLNVIDVTIDGKWIATGSKDSEARLWRFDDSTNTFQCYAVFKGHVGSVSALALPRTPINEYPKFLITAANDLTIKKWKVPKLTKDWDGQEFVIKNSEYTRRAHEKDINAIDISPNDEFIATASYDKLAKIWDLESGETVGILKGHRRGLWDIKFSLYDKKIITSSGDKTAKLWSLTSYQIETNFDGHTNSVQRVKFINKGTQMISTAADGLIKIWDCKSGECLKTIDNHANRIWALDVKSEGYEFVSCDANGQISLWKDNSEEINQKKQQEEELRIENDQRLNNYISQGNFKNAVLIALELNYSMKLFEIFKNIFDSNQQDELIEILQSLNNDQLQLLFNKIKNWNINFKNFEISQNLLYLIFNNISLETLSDAKLMKVIDSLIPYNERHLNRVENLIEESYILDYSIEQMNLIAISANRRFRLMKYNNKMVSQDSKNSLIHSMYSAEFDSISRSNPLLKHNPKNRGYDPSCLGSKYGELSSRPVNHKQMVMERSWSYQIGCLKTQLHNIHRQNHFYKDSLAQLFAKNASLKKRYRKYKRLYKTLYKTSISGPRMGSSDKHETNNSVFQASIKCREPFNKSNINGLKSTSSPRNRQLKSPRNHGEGITLNQPIG